MKDICVNSHRLCRIELKQSGKVLASNAQKFFSDGSSNTFHVHFDNPVQIEVSACMQWNSQ